MKLKEFNFNSLKRTIPTNLAIRLNGGEWYEGCSIGGTLKMIPLSFAEANIKETRWYFNTFVIELEEV